MDLYIKNKEGITLHTQNKYCKEDIAVSVETDEVNVTPSTQNQTYEGLYSKVNIAGDENLVPENILKDKEIFGVKGTAESSGGDEELETSYASSIDDKLGTNITKIPSDITNIRKYAFYDCRNLVIPELSDTITTIGEYAFYYCTNLALTKLPANLTSIKDYTFNSCTNLALTKLPDNITSIGKNAFHQCTNLALTELPSGLTSIGTYAFNFCSNLAITELPSGITAINTSAFNSCTSITELTCLGKITSIGNSAFYGCSNLTKLVLPNVTSVPTLSNVSAFNSTPIANGTGYIYVPDSLVSSFKTKTNWSTYANQIKGISEMT